MIGESPHMENANFSIFFYIVKVEVETLSFL